METVQGYVILKAATFETGHGFALGHNPGAPDPFVTWQFTEGEKGQRDYYWGRYGNSSEWAQRDFDRRVDDYQHLYHAAVKNTELGPDGVYRYYSTQRPVDIGTYPKPPDNLPLSIVNYDDDRRRPVANGRLLKHTEDAAMKLIISNVSGIPIYEQIKQQIKAAILSGELQAEETLPSLRTLAKDLKISVLTVTKAYTELEQEGFVKNVQGRGCPAHF